MSYEHGEWRRYQYEGCRCDTCRFAFHKYRGEVAGKGYCVPSHPVKEHLDNLVKQGYSMRMIAERSGLSFGNLKRIRAGTNPTVYSDTAEVVLSMTSEHFDAPTATVSSVGAMRRLRALAAAGWSLSAISGFAGISSHAHLSHIRTGKRARITTETHREIVEVYDELWDKPPAGLERWAESTRRAAQRAGWHPPMDYDEHELDLAWGKARCERKPGSGIYERKPKVDLDDKQDENAA